MEYVILIFGTLIALNLGFGAVMSEQTGQPNVEVESVQNDAALQPAIYAAGHAAGALPISREDAINL